MVRRSLLLLAALTLAAPQAAMAESVWLVLTNGRGGSYPSVIEKIQMKDMDQCEEQGAAWIASKRLGTGVYYIGFECLEGK